MKKHRRTRSIIAGVTAALMLSALPMSVLPTRVRAASSGEIKEQIEALKEQNREVEQKIEEINAQYEENENEIMDIIARKNVIDQEINLLSGQIVNINDQISAYSVLIADKQEELDEAQDRYDQMMEENRLRIRAMEEEGRISYWQILFKANSFIELLDQLNMMEEIAAADNRRLQELSDAADAVEAAKEALQLEKAGLEETRQELDETQAELDAKREEADALIQELLARAEDLEALQAEFEAQKAEFLEQIAVKEEEYDAAKQAEWEAYMASQAPTAGAEPSGSTDDPTDSGSEASAPASAQWQVPCSYICITSPFGNRDAPTAGASTNHKGVDMGAGRGTPVYASRAGIVTIAGHNYSAGNYVQIDHQDGFKSIYMHLDSYCVSSGQVVSAGQLIGVVGDSGITSGCHLHFGVSYNGEYVNPCSYVDLY